MWRKFESTTALIIVIIIIKVVDGDALVMIFYAPGDAIRWVGE